LNDPSVSPIHALIEKRNGSYYVCDLGSEKGTFKGQNQILDEILESGDELFIGNYKVLFSVGAPRPKVQAPDSIIHSKQNTLIPPPFIPQTSNLENQLEEL
jgi:pSer/pThr/pTyr-binding forkhead associated (FHA) protein